MPADTLEDALGEAKKAARELASASARLSKALIDKAESAARNPQGTARKATKAVAHELDSAAKEINRILRDL